MKAVLLFSYSAEGPLQDVISVLAVIALGGWLWASLRSGELRFRGPPTRRDDDPKVFWIGCGLLALLFVALLLSLVGVLPKL